MATHGEGKFPLHMGGAAQLENLHGATAALPLQHITQNHHIIRYKFFYAIAGNWPIFINALCGHHRGDTNLFKPGNETKNFSPQHRDCIILLEDSRNRINGHSLGLILANCIVNTLNQAR